MNQLPAQGQGQEEAQAAVSKAEELTEGIIDAHTAVDLKRVWRPAEHAAEDSRPEGQEQELAVVGLPFVELP